MKIQNILPQDIEKKSFEIITGILAEMGKSVDERYEKIIKRCIHTSADFEYADSMHFSNGVDSVIIEALKNGADIVTDTQMAKSGINKTTLAKYGGQVHCFIADEDVASEAKERGVTRSFVSMEKASRLGKPVIFAIGNAPTALIALSELIKSGSISPVAIIGVPVGFVNVVESKELIMQLDTPCIIAKGRKGGSNIAAAICNALLYSI